MPANTTRTATTLLLVFLSFFRIVVLYFVLQQATAVVVAFSPPRLTIYSKIIHIRQRSSFVIMSASSSSRDNKSSNPKRPGLEHKQPARPNSCTYWASEHLLAGEHPTDKRGGLDATRNKLEKYLDAGISVFVDLTEPGQKPDYEDLIQDIAKQKKKSEGGDTGTTTTATTAVEYHRLAVPDFSIPTPDLMREILDTIDAAIARNQKFTSTAQEGLVEPEPSLVVI